VSVFLKNHKSSIKYAAGAGLLAFLVILTTCNSPMGMGPIVDTEPPSIHIGTPSDNEYVRGTLLGKPIYMTGICIDDVGVTELRFEVFNNTDNCMVEPVVSYQLVPEGHGTHNWRAELTFPEGVPATADYNIKVIGQDKFGNEGADDVTVRIDTIPPWVEKAEIVRHPGSGFNFSAPLYEREYYVDAGFDLPEAYRNILPNELDEYQNETFTLRVEVKSNFQNVAASRLYIKDENDIALNTDGLEPTGYYDKTDPEREQWYPEWNITGAELEAWRSSFSAGAARYIIFEVWAWSDSAWDGPNNRPYEGEPGRQQKIDGTVWYPESDAPHIYINPDSILNDIITLPPDVTKALEIEFYDDDRLGEIYTKLVLKPDFDVLRGSQREEDYLKSLTDPDDPDDKRATLLATMTNSFTPLPNTNNRHQTVDIATTGLDVGEYRLIALAKDNKSASGYSFEDGEKWSAYPPVMVQIQNAQAPLVIVDSPDRENIFPNLTAGGGEKFTIRGRALGQSPTHTVQIAWVPRSLQANGLNLAAAALNSDQAGALLEGGNFVASNGIKVWKLVLAESTQREINGREYHETNFSQEFHITDDFKVSGVIENENKLFVIHAMNMGGQAAQTFKTFNLAYLRSGPTIYDISHERGKGHDPNIDLVLGMKVRPGNYGVAVKQGSQIITDKDSVNAPFNGPTTLVNGEWQRTVTSLYIKGDEDTGGSNPRHYQEGDVRNYVFYAEDILGNSTLQERDITMSNRPLLESISCANGPGTYGIGELLRFEAVFSLPVRVTRSVANEWPRLKLYLTDPGDGTNVTNPVPLFADYDPNTPSGNTMIFTYTVREGDTTIPGKLYTSLDAIDLNEARITNSNYDNALIEFTAATYVVNSLQSKTEVKLDATRPVITRASFARFVGYDNNNSGISYFNNGRTVTLKLITNEKVMVSGNPEAVLLCDGRQLNAKFASKTASGSGEILTFTYTVNDTVSGVSVPINLKQLEWGAPWFGTLNETNDITDMVGNRIVITGYGTNGSATFLSAANRRGEAVNPYPSEQGYIKTNLPRSPVYTLNGTGGLDPVLANSSVQLGINADGETGTTLYYSLGSTTVSLGAGPVTTPINELDADNRYSTTYAPSQYTVTAWQVDLAGNRSSQTESQERSRKVTISSRWPDLRDRGIDINLPNGSYQLGTAVTFTINLSGMVELKTGASVALGIAGNSAQQTTPLTFTATPAGTSASGKLYTDGGGKSSLLSVDWTFPNTNPATITQTMSNIKVKSIVFNNIEDEYGNVLRAYSGTTAESASNPNRPIGDSAVTYKFQLDRPNVTIRVKGPRVISAVPTLPSTGENYNGGVNSGATFTLTFDAPVAKVAGKYITVRPYDKWVIPPVLSPEDFNSLYNTISNAAVDALPGKTVDETREEYKKRLKNADVYGIPFADSMRGNSNAYNSYMENTHGVTIINSNVRPDTSAKWVLAFDIDPSATTGSTELLREVFNLAGWKQQRIPSGSGSVVVSGSTVTVTLNEALQKGRIWEVLVDAGAFQDLAGYASEPVTEAANTGDGNVKYRFWSSGTETPVIRVDKITYDGRLSYTAGNASATARRDANEALGFIDIDNNLQKVPPIDTKVRIDCETPGAAIRYDVIRTRFRPTAAGSNNGVLNNVLATTTLTTDATFFGSNLRITTTGTQGYQRNTIGNELRTAAANLTTDGFFFTKLLFPNESQTTGVVTTQVLYNNYGTFPASNMTTLQSGLRTGTNLNTGAGSTYRTVSDAGVPSQGTPGSLNYIFIGDAHGTQTNAATAQTGSSQAHSDPSLYTGRRDYIVAAAQKGSVTTAGPSAGPSLAVSATDSAKPYAGMEGVYKTTMIYRSPRTDIYRLLLDARTEVIYDGNPIPGFGMDSNPPGTDIRESNGYKTFYRIGGNLGVAPDAAARNHILVSWEFVADIKRSRPVYYTSTANTPNNNWGAADVGNPAGSINQNGGFISAPYGGVSYRSGGW